MKLKISTIFGLLIIVVILSLLAFYHWHTTKKPLFNGSASKTLMVPSQDKTIVISKQALNDLVKKAANQKYLEDVLAGQPKLPVSTHSPTIAVNQPSTGSIQSTPAAKEEVTTRIKEFIHEPVESEVKENTSNLTSQQCVYRNQIYSIGAIIQIDKGWVRCTPTLQIDSAGNSQYGAAVWTMRDSVL